MKKINLEALNDKEFENLARDLLQEELGKHIESFKSGKDQGIDLRFTTVPGNMTIVQAKHWPNAKISSLVHKIKTEEVPKMMAIKPSGYILFTSLPLSPADKDKILAASQGLINSPGQIYGYDDIENLLNKHGKVFRKTTKLWITSLDVLGRILKNNIDGRSEYSAEAIKNSIRKFVKTTDFPKAKEKLRKLKFLIIKGEPGVGKTTLANILAYHAMADGCELTKAESIDEIETALKPEGKQIFILDDFLGSNFLNIYNENTNGERISKLIERIIKIEGKYIILTSRTTILNKAYSTLQKLESPANKLAEFEVIVESYTTLDKGKILYNHLYDSKAPKEHFFEVSKNNNYLKIIKHKNFNPRIMEFICLKENLSDITHENYIDFIFEQLNNPEKIWKNPFQYQLDDEGRFIVESLFSLGNRASKTTLEAAYEGRVRYEIKNNGFQRKHIPFEDHLRTLSGSFVNLYSSQNDITCRLFTPAIADFLIAHLRANKESRISIYNSAIFSEQLSDTMLSKGNKITPAHEAIKFLIQQSEESHLESIERENTYLTLAGIAAEQDHPDASKTAVRLLRKAKSESNHTVGTQLLSTITKNLIESITESPDEIELKAVLINAIIDSNVDIDWLIDNALALEELAPWGQQPQDLSEKYTETIEDIISTELPEHIESRLDGITIYGEAIEAADDIVFEIKRVYSKVSGCDYYKSSFGISYDEEIIAREISRNTETRKTTKSKATLPSSSSNGELEQLFDIHSWTSSHLY